MDSKDLRHPYLLLVLICLLSFLFVTYKSLRIIIRNRSVRSRPVLMIMYVSMVINIGSCFLVVLSISLNWENDVKVIVTSNVETYTNTLMLFACLGRVAKKVYNISCHENKLALTLYWINWLILAALLASQLPFYFDPEYEAVYIYFAGNCSVVFCYMGALLLTFTYVLLEYRRIFLLSHERLLSSLIIMTMGGEFSYAVYSVLRMYEKFMQNYESGIVCFFVYMNTLLTELGPAALIIFMVERGISKKRGRSLMEISVPNYLVLMSPTTESVSSIRDVV